MYSTQRPSSALDAMMTPAAAKVPGQLPSGTVAVPVIYVCSADVTGLQVVAHFYRVLVPDLKASLLQSAVAAGVGVALNQQFSDTGSVLVEDATSYNSGKQSSSSPVHHVTTTIMEDGSCPIVYVVPRSSTLLSSSTTLPSSFLNPPPPAIAAGGADSIMGASASTKQQRQEATLTAREMILRTVEFARVQFLVMPSSDAQKLLDEAGCVAPKYWNSVSLSALCASADFPVASATALSGVGRVFFDSIFASGGNCNPATSFVDDRQAAAAAASLAAVGASGAVSRVAIVVSITRARRVVHIMNDDVVPAESTVISRQLRSLCATLWYLLCLRANEDALDFVRPVVSGNATVRAAHAARLVHIRRVKKLRESLFRVDATAGAVFQSELTESRTLTQAATAIKQQLYRSIGLVTDLVGAAMRHNVDWSAVERPPYGRELRRTHFRPYIHHQQQQQPQHGALRTSSWPSQQQQQQPLHRPPIHTAVSAAAAVAVSSSDEEPVFLWSKAMTPIQVRLSRQGWERLVQGDPVMWRFKSLPVRLKETTTKLSRLFSCSTGELMISESTQIARATVLRSLPWTPGDVLLLLDGLVPGVYTALASFLKEHHGVVIHTLSMTDPLPKASSSSNDKTAGDAARSRDGGEEPIVSAVARAIDIVKPLVCIIPHITRCGFVLPVEQLIPVCRSRRVVVIVDGTDVLNNVANQIGHYGADFYIAPLDTHLFCPAGLTATVVSKTRKEAVSTLVNSYVYGQGFEEEWTYTGLTDQTRMISIIQALQFNKNVCPGQMQYTKQLAGQAHDLLTRFWNVEPIYKEFESAVIAVMVPLAGQRHDADAKFLQALLVRRGIYVDVMAVKFARGNSKLVVRLQFYPYNDMLEVKRLAIEVCEAIKEIV